MTQDEIIEMATQVYGECNWHYSALLRLKAFVKLVAAKEREALAQTQEPVAWMFQHDETGRMNYVSNDGVHNPTIFLEMNPQYALVCPLYTTPPQRTWVGLTDDEIDSYFEDHGWSPSEDYYPVIRAIEAKLKEKNT